AAAGLEGTAGHFTGVAVVDHEAHLPGVLQREALGAVRGGLAMDGGGHDAHAEVAGKVMVPTDADVAPADAPGPLGRRVSSGSALGRGCSGAWLCEYDPGGGCGQKAAQHDGGDPALANAHRSSLPCRWYRPPCPVNDRA